jgi:hypothetical protein
MNRETAELVRALTGLGKHLPEFITELLSGRLSVQRQHEFAGLLAELAERLDAHADDRERGVIRLPRVELLGPPDQPEGGEPDSP